MHTPGPWTVSGNYVRKLHGSEHGHRVAWICGDGPQPEWIPNAHLIAAAPELLAALEQVKEAFAKLANIAGDVPEWNRGGFAYTASKAVKAAIAKAKRETT